MRMHDKETKKMYLTVADLSTVGIAVILSFVAGLGLGIYLDSRFGTYPILTGVFMLLGIISGFSIMYKNYKKFFDESTSEGTKK